MSNKSNIYKKIS